MIRKTAELGSKEPFQGLPLARLLDVFGRVTANDALEIPRERLDARLVREQEGDRAVIDLPSAAQLVLEKIE